MRGIPEEDEGSIPQDGPHSGFGSKSLLVPKSVDRQTLPATEVDPCQEDFNSAPWRMPPERLELPKRASDLRGPPTSNPEGRGKGVDCRRLVLRPRHHGRGATMVSRGSG